LIKRLAHESFAMPLKASRFKSTAWELVTRRQPEWSAWNRAIFEFGEPAWREYQSADFYTELLTREGFAVERGTGGMPTAFCARWSQGSGTLPTIGGYAEYDAVPGNCQAADTVRRPRDGLSADAAGHTDPHSALGMGSFVGFLAAKHAMERHGVPGRLVFFGEPAEKVRGSKPIHAAAGFYDELDAAISFHPFYMQPLCNTVRWDTHCGAGYAPLYTFAAREPATWLAAPGAGGQPIPEYHSAARMPGATDAVIQMYQTAKTLKEHVLASGQSWSMNEAILALGQATADNLPGRRGQISYMIRVPTVAQAEHVVRALDLFAETAARLTHCDWTRAWIAKSRPGLANHALARLTYANLEHCSKTSGWRRWWPRSLRRSPPSRRRRKRSGG
jgi:aminobenzoyl-glutamate utilization protein B